VRLGDQLVAQRPAAVVAGQRRRDHAQADDAEQDADRVQPLDHAGGTGQLLGPRICAVEAVAAAGDEGQAGAERGDRGRGSERADDEPAPPQRQPFGEECLEHQRPPRSRPVSTWRDVRGAASSGSDG
jgi:hypothetical protein